MELFLFIVLAIILLSLLTSLFIYIKKGIEKKLNVIRLNKLKKSIEDNRLKFAHYLPDFIDGFYPIFFYANNPYPAHAHDADYLDYYASIYELGEYMNDLEMEDYLARSAKPVIPKEGKSERHLSKALELKFGKLVKTSQQIGKYYPDLVIQDPNKNLHLVIEIDERTTKVVDVVDDNEFEPYLKTVKIHSEENIPSLRTKELVEQGWCVLRFSEEQVVEDLEGCVYIVSSTLTYLAGNKSYLYDKGTKKIIRVPVYT